MVKTQYAWVFYIVAGFIIVLSAISKADPTASALLTAVMAFVLLLFYKLTIKVNYSYIAFSFGIGLIRRKYRLQDITSCRAVKYFPLGWGVRFRPGVTIYNVSGNKAIELKLKGKKRKIWIGTDNPEEISQYINFRLNKINKNSLE